MKFRKIKKKTQADVRKQQRKTKRLQKKKNKLQHYKKRKLSEQQPKHEKQHPIVGQPKSILKKPKKKKPQQPQSSQDEDDKIIKMYSGKLKGSKRKLKNDLLNDGFDDDLFQFLEGITSKVKGKRKGRVEEEVEEEQQEGMEEEFQGGEEEEFQQNFDGDMVQQQQQQQQQFQQPQPPTATPQQTIKLQKSITGLLNKLSDQNLLKIFKQLNDLFELSPTTSPQLLSNIFLKLNIDNPRMLLNILATNVAVVCGLQQIHGNGVVAAVLKKLVERFKQLGNNSKLQEDRLPCLKNIANSISYMYLFNTITSTFIKGLIEQLIQNIDTIKLELMLVLITTVGTKLRQDDPKTLKDIIEVVRERFEGSEELKGNKKAGFILDEINQIKFNRKEGKLDTRFVFLNTFIRKDILQRNNLQPTIFLLTFQQVSTADKSNPLWFEPNSQSNKFQDKQQIGRELIGQQKYYEELARQQKMVTQFRKKVFLAVITSQDFVEAADRILQLKSKKLNQISSVIVQTCSQQKTFNPFYPLLITKLITLLPRFRPAFQFSLWDQQKQLQDYSLRKISNLAKLLARVTLMSPSCSLSMLKNFDDLGSVTAHQQIFLTVYFEEMFGGVTRVRVGELVGKLRDSNENAVFKEVLLEYLRDEYLPTARKTGKKYVQMVVLMVRLLSIRKEQPRQQML